MTRYLSWRDVFQDKISLLTGYFTWQDISLGRIFYMTRHLSWQDILPDKISLLAGYLTWQDISLDRIFSRQDIFHHRIFSWRVKFIGMSFFLKCLVIFHSDALILLQWRQLSSQYKDGGRYLKELQERPFQEPLVSSYDKNDELVGHLRRPFFPVTELWPFTSPVFPNCWGHFWHNQFIARAMRLFQG